MPRHTDMARSERLHNHLALALPSVWSFTDVLVARAADPSVYRRYLITQHAIVRATVPLLEAAAQRSAELADGGDLSAQRLCRYFQLLTEEERGHDVWLLEDIAAADGDPTQAMNQLPDVAVAAMIGSQYYWIYHFHPVAILGFIQLMEGYPPRLQFVDALRRATGLGEAAFRSLAQHAVLDIGHGRMLEEIMDALELSDSQEDAIFSNGLATIRCLIDIYTRMLKEAPRDPSDSPTYAA